MRDVWIVDIDGTLALRGERDPFNWEYVGEDQPNRAVIMVARALCQYTPLIFVSGRKDKGTCRRQTEMWLHENLCDFSRSGQAVCIHDYPLHMRAADDDRPDDVVKLEIYRTHIEGKYNVVGVLDDRQRVVDMWRDTLGLTVLQCAPGQF